MKCSVIIPCNNSEKTIGRCLESLNSQSYRPFEAIVVLDRCTDKTREIALRLGARVIGSKGMGSYAARNTGARHSAGEYLVFIDSDCIPDKSWLFEIMPVVRRHGLVSGQIKAYSKSGLISRYSGAFMHDQESYAKSGLAATSNMAVSRKLFDMLGGFRPVMFGGDFDFCSRSPAKPVYCSKAVVRHIYDDSLLKFIKRNYNYGRWKTTGNVRLPTAREVYSRYGTSFFAMRLVQDISFHFGRLNSGN